MRINYGRLLIAIEGNRYYGDFGVGICKHCDGTGKSQTILLFDAGSFKCKRCRGVGTIQDTVQPLIVEKVVCRGCKGTGYFLPKKRDIININCDRDYIIEDKKFCLFSDAVLKSAFDFNIEVEDKFTEEQEKVWHNYVVDNNISESQKMVIIEGYYE